LEKAMKLDIPAVPWKLDRRPRKILAIRLQAMGDLVITLPYLLRLRSMLPAESRIDLLTREEVDSIPRNIELFDHVYSIGGGRDFKKQVMHTAWLLPRLMARRYEVVLDLQNNEISRAVQRCIRPMAWSRFDRLSPVPAGERTRLTMEAAGLGGCQPASGFRFRDPEPAAPLLAENGWQPGHPLVVLNPAGAFVTRNWPLENYAKFADLWTALFPKTQFLILGTGLIGEKAGYLKTELKERLINLADKTSPFEAFAVIQKVQLMLTEDSGLMHMAWVSGIPTLALFGSTRSDRSRPLGPKSRLLDSSDLPCGNCMLEECRFGDTRCLLRYSPEKVLEEALALVQPGKG
jgi:ADP-heptose:LPS heptosyltransferase